MAMNIEGTRNAQAIEQNHKANSKSPPQASKEPEANKPSDSVNLSTRGNAAKILESTPVVDPKRVEELKGMIEKGTYKVDPNQLASNMIEFEKNLPNTG